jgi:hypothetical protein
MKTSRVLLLGLLGAAVVIAGCASTSEDDAESSDEAEVVAMDDDDEFDVKDRMGRPEMTNVTIGAGLVRLKVAKDGFAKAKAAAEAAPGDAEKAALAAQLGAELQTLAKELGAPASDTLKAELAQDAAMAAAPTTERRPSGYFRAYNRQHTFHPKPGERDDAKRLLAAGIRALDTYIIVEGTPDEPAARDKQDWSEQEIEKISEILAEDALVVDLAGTCTHDTQSYFAIERAAFTSEGDGGSGGRSCGGRTLNDDIIDDTLTMWIAKSFDFGRGNPRRVGDNVVAVTAPGTAGAYELSPAIKAFPYLGEPRSAPLIGAGVCSGKAPTPTRQCAAPQATP